MEFKMDYVGDRNGLKKALRDHILEIEAEEKKEHEEKMKARRAKVPFTDEQIIGVVRSMSKNKVDTYFDEDSSDTAFEDDGFIHVRRAGIRFVKAGSESQLTSFTANVEKQIKKMQEAQK